MKILLMSMLGALMICSSALAMSIIKPQKGDTYLVGQTLTVELQALPEEDVEQILINTNHFGGAAISSSPFKYDFKLDAPVDGQEAIGAVAILKNGETVLLSTYIYVKLPADIEVKDIDLERNLLVVTIKPNKARSRIINAFGIESNGNKYPLKFYSQAQYQSLNEAIATVDLNGVISGVSPGETKVIVSAGNISKEVKVFVEYRIDPIKGITVTALDKANEVKWEKSPYEGEIVSEYRVYKSRSKYGSNKKLIGTVTLGTSSFTDTQPASGADYYYSVQAYSLKYRSGSDMEQWVTATPAW